MLRCARFRSGTSARRPSVVDANTARSQEAIGRRAPVLLAGLTRCAVRVLDWDLRRGGGFSYRIYLFAKD